MADECPCLTCALRATIQDYYEENGDRIGDDFVLDAREAIECCARLIAELVAADPDATRRASACKSIASEIKLAVKAIRDTGRQHRKVSVVLDDGEDVGRVH